jgi:hypothetical protein
MNWVDVNENLPFKFESQILCVDSQGDVYIAMYSHPKNNWIDKSSSDHKKLVFIENVTHWIKIELPVN